jgi:hypothetical protein
MPRTGGDVSNEEFTGERTTAQQHETDHLIVLDRESARRGSFPRV